jgi:hypothetical protein
MSATPPIPLSHSEQASFGVSLFAARGAAAGSVRGVQKRVRAIRSHAYACVLHTAPAADLLRIIELLLVATCIAP